MIELKLEPYCQHCSGFEAETRHQVLFSGADIYEDSTTIVCENALKCENLYNYICRNMEDKRQ